MRSSSQVCLNVFPLFQTELQEGLVCVWFDACYCPDDTVSSRSDGEWARPSWHHPPLVPVSVRAYFPGLIEPLFVLLFHSSPPYLVSSVANSTYLILTAGQDSYCNQQWHIGLFYVQVQACVTETMVDHIITHFWCVSQTFRVCFGLQADKLCIALYTNSLQTQQKLLAKPSTDYIRRQTWPGIK